MEVIALQNTWNDRRNGDFGWGNGYVLIDSSHPLYGKNWDEIDLDIHGGITFSRPLTPELAATLGLGAEVEVEGKWCIGFDTNHGGDTLDKWPESRVKKEAEKLKQLLEAPLQDSSASEKIKGVLIGAEELQAFIDELWENSHSAGTFDGSEVEQLMLKHGLLVACQYQEDPTDISSEWFEGYQTIDLSKRLCWPLKSDMATHYKLSIN